MDRITLMFLIKCAVSLGALHSAEVKRLVGAIKYECQASPDVLEDPVWNLHLSWRSCLFKEFHL